MRSAVAIHLQNTLKHLYINPLERCNLRCQICYTKKTAPTLTQENILAFVNRYKAHTSLNVITFCGGEVMLLPYMPALINTLTERGIYVQIITNGTIDRLAEFTNPHLVNCIVSIDGLPAYHEKNRGKGTFEKSVGFLKRCRELGFRSEIFSIVTADNFSDIEAFEAYLQTLLGAIEITYHPRKPPEYLQNHPISNIQGSLAGFGFVTPQQLKTLYTTRNVFPPPDLGCYQISLVSDGKVYACCEGTKPIGTIDDDITHLITEYTNRLITWEQQEDGKQKSSCLGCTQPDFVCGVKSLIASL